jgi:hypothetical protein
MKPSFPVFVGRVENLQAIYFVSILVLLTCRAPEQDGVAVTWRAPPYVESTLFEFALNNVVGNQDRDLNDNALTE